MKLLKIYIARNNTKKLFLAKKNFCWGSQFLVFVIISLCYSVEIWQRSVFFYCCGYFRLCVWTHTTKLSSSLFLIEIPVRSQERERSCICCVGVSILPLSTIFPLDVGTVPTDWYFLFCFLLLLFFHWSTDELSKLLAMTQINFFLIKTKLKALKNIASS